MTAKKQIQPDEKVPLKLSAIERKLVLEDLTCLDKAHEQAVRNSQIGKPVMMTLDGLDNLAGYIAAESNHCEDRKKQKKLDALFEKVQDLLGKYTDEEPPQTFKIEDARKEKLVSGQSIQIAEFAAKALIAAEQLRIKTKPLDNFWLAPAQRDVLLLIPSFSRAIKNKLAKEKPLTVAEVASITMALAEDLPSGETQKQVALLLIAKHLMDRLQEGITATGEPKPQGTSKRTAKRKTDVLYQFKITLLGYKPLIWRRIQVQDCTLDKLHEHIQTAMGWTNSHLHQFVIREKRYGDPGLMDDLDCLDSTATMVSEILPKHGKRYAFKYDYDFGDGWEHEVLYEGSPSVEKGKRYPICLEGERACPPEDIGGVWGYAAYLEALAEPKHELHEEYMEWNGPFDPNDFDSKKATKAMKKGLPNWRDR